MVAGRRTNNPSVVKTLAVFLILIAHNVTAVATPEKLVHVVRFSDYREGPIDDWLQAKAFQFEQDAKRRDRIDLDIGSAWLEMASKRRAFGIIFNESVNVPEFTRIEVDWGVNRFPSGSSYEQGVRNEALMLIVFMGDERHPSGSMFVPNSPYFIGLFLCHGDDKVGHPYIGHYFKKGGRYVCTDKPTAGELITSSFNLLDGYREYFDRDRDDDPAISGIALTMDTRKAGSSGKASAFIREIRFYR